MKKIHIKTAFSYLRREPFQALAAVFVLTITFFVTTVLSLFVYSSSKVIDYFETRPQVIAFLKDEISMEQVSKLQGVLLEDARIGEVKYVSKEDALEIYKSATSDNPLLSELIKPDIFPASLEFSLNDLSYFNEIYDMLSSEEIVDEVQFTASLTSDAKPTDTVARLRKIANYIRIGGLVFVSMLITASFVVLFIIISMRMVTRRSEIEVLRLIGASPAFIRSPIIIESLSYAFLGALAGWLMAFLLVLYITPSFLSYFGKIPVLPSTTYELLGVFAIVFAGELILAFLLSVTGGLVAIKRSKKKK